MIIYFYLYVNAKNISLINLEIKHADFIYQKNYANKTLRCKLLIYQLIYCLNFILSKTFKSFVKTYL